MLDRFDGIHLLLQLLAVVPDFLDNIAKGRLGNVSQGLAEDDQPLTDFFLGALFDFGEVDSDDEVLGVVSSGFNVVFDLILDQTDAVLDVADRA